jgi:hypothetical protein
MVVAPQKNLDSLPFMRAAVQDGNLAFQAVQLKGVVDRASKLDAVFKDVFEKDIARHVALNANAGADQNDLEANAVREIVSQYRRDILSNKKHPQHSKWREFADKAAAKGFAVMEYGDKDKPSVALVDISQLKQTYQSMKTGAAKNTPEGIQDKAIEDILKVPDSRLAEEMTRTGKWLLIQQELLEEAQKKIARNLNTESFAEVAVRVGEAANKTWAGKAVRGYAGATTAVVAGAALFEFLPKAWDLGVNAIESASSTMISGGAGQLYSVVDTSKNFSMLGEQFLQIGQADGVVQTAVEATGFMGHVLDVIVQTAADIALTGLGVSGLNVAVAAGLAIGMGAAIHYGDKALGAAVNDSSLSTHLLRELSPEAVAPKRGYHAAVDKAASLKEDGYLPRAAKAVVDPFGAIGSRLDKRVKEGAYRVPPAPKVAEEIIIDGAKYNVSGKSFVERVQEQRNQPTQSAPPVSNVNTATQHQTNVPNNQAQQKPSVQKVVVAETNERWIENNFKQEALVKSTNLWGAIARDHLDNTKFLEKFKEVVAENDPSKRQEQMIALLLETSKVEGKLGVNRDEVAGQLYGMLSSMKDEAKAQDLAVDFDKSVIGIKSEQLAINLVRLNPSIQVDKSAILSMIGRTLDYRDSLDKKMVTEGILRNLRSSGYEDEQIDRFRDVIPKIVNARVRLPSEVGMPEDTFKDIVKKVEKVRREELSMNNGKGGLTGPSGGGPAP